MAATSPGPLPDISPRSSLMVEMSSSSSMFHRTKLKFQHRLLGDSSLNLTSIQPSTVHGCFSSARCDLLFFSFGVTDGLLLAFLDENPIFLQLVSYSSLTNFDSCLCSFVFHLFCCIFFYFQTCCSEFSVLTIGQPVRFLLYNPPTTCLIQVLDTANG